MNTQGHELDFLKKKGRKWDIPQDILLEEKQKNKWKPEKLALFKLEASCARCHKGVYYGYKNSLIRKCSTKGCRPAEELITKQEYFEALALYEKQEIEKKNVITARI